MKAEPLAAVLNSRESLRATTDTVIGYNPVSRHHSYALRPKQTDRGELEGIRICIRYKLEAQTASKLDQIVIETEAYETVSKRRSLSTQKHGLTSG